MFYGLRFLALGGGIGLAYAAATGADMVAYSGTGALWGFGIGFVMLFAKELLNRIKE